MAISRNRRAVGKVLQKRRKSKTAAAPTGPPPVDPKSLDLSRDGVMVIDLLTRQEAEEADKSLVQHLAVVHRDIKPTYSYKTKAGNTLTKQTQLVGGGFGALAGFEENFGPTVDALRRKAHEAFVAHLVAAGHHKGLEAVALPDRVMERLKGEGNAAKGPTTVHKDHCPCPLPEGSEIFGGFLVLRGAQCFVFERGSHTPEARGSFDKFPPEEQKKRYAKMVSVPLRPGQLVMFRQTIVHAVAGGVAKEPLRRVFIGASAMPPGPSLYERLGVDMKDHFDRGLMTPVKSGEHCAVFPRNWLGFGTSRLVAWAHAVHGVPAEVESVKKWVAEELGGFGERRYPALADQGKQVPPVDRDLFLVPVPL